MNTKARGLWAFLSLRNQTSTMSYNTIKKSVLQPGVYYWNVADYLVPVCYFLIYAYQFNEPLTAEEVGQEMGGN